VFHPCGIVNGMLVQQSANHASQSTWTLSQAVSLRSEYKPVRKIRQTAAAST
jgi:hypothetical protein